ncbi:MAG: hypothetical protein ACLSAF_10995 [Intestinimonas sp.]
MGGSSSSNNIGPWISINIIKRVAWGVRELEDIRGRKQRISLGEQPERGQGGRCDAPGAGTADRGEADVR